MRLSELGVGVKPEIMEGLSGEAEEWNRRLPLIFTLRLWVKQRESPLGAGIKEVLCSCPRAGKHSAGTMDLIPLPPGSLPETRLVFPFFEISNSHYDSILCTRVRRYSVKEMFYYFFVFY